MYMCVCFFSLCSQKKQDEALGASHVHMSSLCVCLCYCGMCALWYEPNRNKFSALLLVGSGGMEYGSLTSQTLRSGTVFGPSIVWIRYSEHES